MKFPVPKASKALLYHAAKTGLAAALTNLVVDYLKMPQGYWAVISTIFVMQSHLGGAIMAGWSRLVGTAAGAFLAAVCASLFGVSTFSLALAVAATVLICSSFAFLRESTRIAAIAAGIVMLAAASGAQSWHVAAMRFLEIGLGIAVALGVALAWPSRAVKPLRRGLASGLKTSAELVSTALASLFGGQDREKDIRELTKRLAARLAANAALCDETRAETRNSQDTEALFAVHRIERRLLDHTADLAHLAEDPVPQGFHELVKPELYGLESQIRTCLEGLAFSLQNQVMPPDLTALGAAVAVVEAHMTRLRKMRVLSQYDLAEISRFFSLLHGMLAVAEEIAEIVSVLEELYPQSEKQVHAQAKTEA